MQALHVACKYGKLDVARLLIERGADANRRIEDYYVS